jgi:hypothetical protein
VKRGRFDYLETMVGIKPEGWTLDTTILRESEAPDVMCVVECWARAGLAVHEIEILINDAKGVPNTRVRLGRITHKRTGYRVVDCISLDDAVTIVELIENATDWNAIKGRGEAGIWPKVQAKIETMFMPDKQIVAWLTVYRPKEKVAA